MMHNVAKSSSYIADYEGNASTAIRSGDGGDRVEAHKDVLCDKELLS